MEETIKGVEVIAYKGMNSDMICRDFQYEIGKSYKTDKAELCKCGFHACLNPLDVLGYYPFFDSRYYYQVNKYFKVLLSGEITKCNSSDTNVAATEITILEEINIDEVIKTTEWWKNDNVLDLLYWSEDFAKVQRGDNLFNFIGKQGNILSNEWLLYIYPFHDGFARVRRGTDKLWNFIDKEGKYLFDEWFRDIYPLYYDFVMVQRTNGQCCIINSNSKLM